MPTLTTPSARSRAVQRNGARPQRGMSLVELMVGVTIGLFIVAAATLLVGNQLTDNRRLLLETQLQQDMRAAMDIMTRQVRRSGTRRINESESLVAGVSNSKAGEFDPEYTGVELGAGQDKITFDYYLNPSNDTRLSPGSPLKNWGFQLADGRISSNLAGGNDDDAWQELTDRGAVKVTRLQFVEGNTASEVVACPKLCTDGTTACWPRSLVRTYTITLEAEAASDPLVRRRMQSVARVRNNVPVFNNGSTTQPCPP